MGGLKEIKKPLFYILTRYTKTAVTGHVIAANNEQEALEIAIKYNISYKQYGQVKRRNVHKCAYLAKGRNIWYESNGTIQRWKYTGESIDPSSTTPAP